MVGGGGLGGGTPLRTGRGRRRDGPEPGSPASLPGSASAGACGSGCELLTAAQPGDPGFGDARGRSSQRSGFRPPSASPTASSRPGPRAPGLLCAVPSGVSAVSAWGGTQAQSLEAGPPGHQAKPPEVIERGSGVRVEAVGGVWVPRAGGGGGGIGRGPHDGTMLVPGCCADCEPGATGPGRESHVWGTGIKR